MKEYKKKDNLSGNSIVISFRLSFSNEKDFLIYKCMNLLRKSKRTSTFKFILYNYFKNFIEQNHQSYPFLKKIQEMNVEEYELYLKNGGNKNFANSRNSRLDKRNNEDKKSQSSIDIDDLIY